MESPSDDNSDIGGEQPQASEQASEVFVADNCIGPLVQPEPQVPHSFPAFQAFVDTLGDVNRAILDTFNKDRINKVQEPSDVAINAGIANHFLNSTCLTFGNELAQDVLDGWGEHKRWLDNLAAAVQPPLAIEDAKAESETLSEASAAPKPKPKTPPKKRSESHKKGKKKRSSSKKQDKH